MTEAAGALGGVWQAYFDGPSGYQVVVEDNGRVAYAYLLDSDQQIVSDVWLYNRCDTPVKPEWTDPDKLPFANPAGFVRLDGAIMPINRAEEVEIVWIQVSGVMAQIHIRNTLAGVLALDARPGWSVMAAKDGPLARMLLP